jgi:hypothetical protein
VDTAVRLLFPCILKREREEERVRGSEGERVKVEEGMPQ